MLCSDRADARICGRGIPAVIFAILIGLSVRIRHIASALVQDLHIVKGWLTPPIR